jgi:uncharacterized protein
MNISKYYLIMGKACNLQCIYCHQGERKPNFDSYNTTVDPIKVANYFPCDEEYKVIFYGGEPLLYYDKIIKIAYAIKERNNKAELSIITNGTMLTLEKAKGLNDLGIGIAISHDGKYFETTRKTRDFLKVDPEPYLTLTHRSISAVVCRVNYDFYDIWDYFDEFQVKHGLPEKENVCIQVVKDVEGNTADKLLINDIAEFELMLDRVFSSLEINIKDANLGCWEFKQYLPMIKVLNWRLHNPNTIGTVWCGTDSQVCNIDMFGNLYPCHNSMEPNGNLYTSGIKVTGTNPNKRNRECLNCSAYIYCGGGCPVTAPENRKAMCYTIYQQVSRLLRTLGNLRGYIIWNGLL